MMAIRRWPVMTKMTKKTVEAIGKNKSANDAIVTISHIFFIALINLLHIYKHVKLLSCYGLRRKKRSIHFWLTVVNQT